MLKKTKLICHFSANRNFEALLKFYHIQSQSKQVLHFCDSSFGGDVFPVHDANLF